MPTTTKVAAQQAWPCCFCTISFLSTVKEMTDGLKAGASSESTHPQSCETKLMLRLGQPRPPGDRQRRACRVVFFFKQGGWHVDWCATRSRAPSPASRAVQTPDAVRLGTKSKAQHATDNICLQHQEIREPRLRWV